jgi:hypothetical protein
MLVNHTTETVATLDTSAPLRRRTYQRTRRAGRRGAQRSMRPVAIVMIHENVEDAFKMLVVQDQQSVETR